MGPFTAGQVVLLPFPFSDLSRNKLRPALLLAHAGRTDWIACQITSNPYADPRAVQLEAEGFSLGGLQIVSYIRPGKLFTANETLIEADAGLVNPQMLEKVRNAVITIVFERP
jgi:mRNA interferase MazF